MIKENNIKNYVKTEIKIFPGRPCLSVRKYQNILTS